MSLLKSLNFLKRISRVQSLKLCGANLEAYRGLYSASSLGLDTFIEQQDRVRNQLLNIQDKFKTKMIENTTEESKNIIFSEDLKNMIHIATDADIEIVINMMKKFNKQNKELRFGNFVFGAVVMRMFYVLNKPKEALECFKSPDLEGFFDQLISYQLLCDLLYENQLYKDILECFNIIQDRQVGGMKYPRNIVVLVIAACYKMNTPESLEYAIKLWKDLIDVGHMPARRAVTFFAKLLLNNDKPEHALEVLGVVQNQNYTTVRNLKVLILTKLNRLDDTIPILKSILKLEQVQTFNKDVLDALQEQLQQQNNTELLTEFNHLMKIFQEQKHISDVTLDEQLSSEIVNPKLQKQHRNQNRFQSNRPFRPRENFQRRERAPLREME
ncbi:pentatricopeptide repeat-containing protein 2 mitochondrial [Holotrichia oblita]|uniref:Pentatricopeptide repeat-containing protein 2 mitochondrial n=1 Tax=Holotrichia oblita TaxID=644536 RepID=A0ACB9TL76_HOLOL|nr:pentatricopeptide repeat-containing protein 2 mitochondrial [Holotrichia oblita]